MTRIPRDVRRVVLTFILIVFALGLSCWGLISSGLLFDYVAGDKGTEEIPTLQLELEVLRINLESHVKELASKIGQRSYLVPSKLDKAAAYIKNQLERRAPKQSVRVWPYKVADLPSKQRYRCTTPRCSSEFKDYDEIARNIGGIEFKNIELEIPGKNPNEIIVIGAHYGSDACESAGCTLGADDNATGVAALIELAGLLIKKRNPEKTLRFVAFTNEEEPFFQTETMGSYVYAREPRKPKERVRWMLSLETMGYFSDKSHSQEPRWLAQLLGFPTTGHFITFVGNWDSADLTRESVRAFRGIPAQGLITYSQIPRINWSDHWSYWQLGVQAVMVTDTALLRNFCYHKDCDIPQRLDYDKLARVVMGLAEVIKTLDVRP